MLDVGREILNAGLCKGRREYLSSYPMFCWIGKTDGRAGAGDSGIEVSILDEFGACLRDLLEEFRIVDMNFVDADPDNTSYKPL